MNYRIAALSLLLLSGCTTYWIKEPMTEEQSQRDQYECRLQSEGIASTPRTYAPNVTQGGWIGAAQSGQALSNAGEGLADTSRRLSLYSQCMRARGYTPLSKDQLPIR